MIPTARPTSSNVRTLRTRGSLARAAACALLPAVIVQAAAVLGACSAAPTDDADGSNALSAAPPAGSTLLEAGDQISLLGITDDGYAVYSSIKAGVHAVSLTGGKPVILSTDGTAYAKVTHTSVLVWSGTGKTTLSLWSSALGTPKVVTTKAYPQVAAASADGLHIAYVADETSGKSVRPTATLYGAHVATLSAPQKLVTDVDLDPSDTDGSLALRFTGAGAGAHLVATYTRPGVVTKTVPFPASTDIVLATSVVNWTSTEYSVPALAAADATPVVELDGSGQSFTLGATFGHLNVLPLDSSAPALHFSETLGAATDAPPFVFSPTDQLVVYATAQGVLERSSTSADTSVKLSTSSDVTGVMGLSPDQKWALLSIDADNQGYGGTVGLASTATAGKPSVYSAGQVAGDAFSADSKFGVFVTHVTTSMADPANVSLGTIDAVSVSNPSVTITLATKTAFASAPDVVALAGSSILYNDNGSEAIDGTIRVDVHVADLTLATPVKLVVSGVDPVYAVSSDKKSLVYTVNSSGKSSGIYVTAVPAL